MKISVKELRSIIKSVLKETHGGGWASPMMPFSGAGVDLASREQIGKMKNPQLDPEDEIADHLEEPEIKPEDTYGPVPPTQGDPWVSQDPFVRDQNPSTARGITR